MKILIAYIIVAEIYESIHFYVGYRKFLKYKNGSDTIKSFMASVLTSSSMKMLLGRALNPFTIAFVIAPLVLIVNLFIFPFSVFYLVREILGIKSRIQIKAEAEMESYERSERRKRIRSVDFMKNEEMKIPVETNPTNLN